MSQDESRGQWKVRAGGEEVGPVDVEILRHWARVGRLGADDLVLNPEIGAWVRAETVPQLAGLFAPSPEARPRSALAGPLPARTVLIGLFGAAVLLVLSVTMCVEPNRERARRKACLCNHMQLLLALKQYTCDFSEVYPWQVGRERPEDAWCDLGILYPTYDSAFETFFCPSSKDKVFEPRCRSGKKEDYPLEPLDPQNKWERTSYAYSHDNRTGTRVPWTEDAPSTVVLLADKKAGLEIRKGGPNPPSKANHGDRGRITGWLDGHVKWRSGPKPLDPDETDDEIGKPDAADYSAWWSDPPFYGE